METETLQTILNGFEINRHFSIVHVKDFTEKCLQKKDEHDYSDDDSGSLQPSKDDAYRLVNQVVSHPTDGTPGDYHDYAVVFAKAGDYTYACEVLLLGLKKYSTHVDLLSDFLLYATRSSKDEHYELCEEKYERLKTRRPLWNWRAYDFSFEYLLDKLNRGRGDLEKLKAECLELAREFQVNVPTNELGGVSLARIYLKQGNPDMAMECLVSVIKNIPRIVSAISPERAWFLLITSKIAKFLSGETLNFNTEQKVDMVLVKEIVNDWNKIKSLSNTNKQDYKDTKILVEFVKVISGYESADDEEA